MSRRTALALAAILALGALLLLYRLGGLSLSVDEFVNVEIERGTWGQIMSDLRRGQDLHPPLSHLIMSVWFRLVGESDWSARLPWALVSIVSLWLVFCLGRTLTDTRVGLAAAALMATAPTFLLYSRFDKYYALTVMLFLATSLAGIDLWRQATARSGARYVLLLSALLYTDYLAPLALLLGQGTLLVVGHRQSQRTRAFLCAWAVALVLYLPWLAMLAAQTRVLSGMTEADLASGAVGLVLKLGYLGYSLLVGETIFPWTAPGVAGVVGGLTAGALGLGTLRRFRPPSLPGNSLGVVLALLLPGIAASALLTSWVFRAVPFVAFANHVLFALPLASIILAGSVAARKRLWPVAALSLLLVGRAVAIGNYFAGASFHNPIYAVPMREVVASLAAEAQVGDVILADPDTGFDYYYTRTRQPAPLMSTTDPAPALAYLQEVRPRRAWLVTFGRDRTRDAVPPDVRNWLDRHYVATRTDGYVEQDPIYSVLKERLFGRPNYRYKLLVVRYERPA